jgi:hypothetical protein
MNATKLIIAAGFAIATTGAFAENTVTTYSANHVSNVYGRASAPVVQVTNKVADSETGKGDTKVAVTVSKDAVEFGRS